MPKSSCYQAGWTPEWLGVSSEMEYVYLPRFYVCLCIEVVFEILIPKSSSILFYLNVHKGARDVTDSNIEIIA